MRKFAKRASFVFLGLVGCVQSALAQQTPDDASAPRLVATRALQDEPIKLPEDMTALFSNQDRRVRFQVVKLSSDERQLFANKVISVINPEGQTQRVQTDSSGYASMDMASAGLHAVVVSEDSGHSAIPLAVRQVSDDEAKAKAKAVRIPLVDVDPSEVLAAVRSTVSSGNQGASSTIDRAIVDKAPIDDPFGYSVMLSNEGTLKGKVISLLTQPSNISVEGSQVTIFQNQNVVATALADANGGFELPLAAGYYGLICTSQAGYAAFGFQARDESEVAANDQAAGYTLVSTRMVTMQSSGMSFLPVILVPQPMMDSVLQSVEEFYAPPLTSGVTPVTPFGGPAGFGGGLGGGVGGGAGAGAAGGLGGAGGLLGLAAAGGVAAAAIGANNNNNNQDFVPLPNTTIVP